MARSRKRAYKKVKGSNLTSDLEKFKEIPTQSRKVCPRASSDFINNYVSDNSSNSNPKKFYILTL